MQLHFGKKIVPAAVKHQDDDDNIWGPSWHAHRDGAGFVLDYATGDLANRQRSFTIDRAEFDQLRADPAAVDDIIRAHGG